MKNKKLIKIISLATIAGILYVNFGNEVNAKTGNSNGADKFLTNWFQAVSSGNPNKVLELYKKDAVLLPTLSNEVHDLPEERLNYFKMFTSLKNIKGTINEIHTQKLSDNVVNQSGIYTFTFEKDGKIVKVPARFSFTLVKDGNKWVVAEHHSSKMPIE